MAAIVAATLLGGLLVPPRTSAYTSHAPILIEGDANFTAANGVVGGNGTAANPHVIAGWEIDASTGDGIHIRNASAHFVVRDVYIHSGGAAYSGVRLERVANGTVRNGTFEGNRNGVYVGYSSNVSVAFNNLTANENGIVVADYSADVAVSNNTVTSNARDGILLWWYVTRAAVSGNIVTDNLWGIHQGYSDHVTIEWNRVYRNRAYGILVSSSSSSTLFSDKLTEDNLEIRDSQRIDVVKTGVTAGEGLTVIASQSITIVESFLVLNVPDGVALFSSIDVSVYHNVFLFNGAYDDGLQNRWDNGYPSGGNLWDTYVGADSCSGPAQDVCPDPDGIGDFPHQFDADSFDEYPLMNPKSEYVPPEPPALVAAVLTGAGAEDVQITWTASSDEGAPGGAVEYRIMRATNFAGPYRTIATIPANGSASYEYPCSGCGHDPADVTTYLYKIRAVDAANNSADSGLAAKYARRVVPGPNLLTIPLVQADWSLAAVFRTVAYDVVRTYLASDPADPWKALYPSRPGDLPPLAFGAALWVRATAGGTYTVAGLVAPDPSVVLEPGWNLVAYATFVNRTRDASLAGIPGVARVEGFDPASPDPYRLRAVAGDEWLVPGDAYWLLMTQRATWIQG